MFRAIFYFIFYMFLGYVILKTFRYLKNIFFGSSQSNNSRVNDTQPNQKTINTKDIIEADFEEIDEKENNNKADGKE